MYTRRRLQGTSVIHRKSKGEARRACKRHYANIDWDERRTALLTFFLFVHRFDREALEGTRNRQTSTRKCFDRGPPFELQFVTRNTTNVPLFPRKIHRHPRTVAPRTLLKFAPRIRERKKFGLQLRHSKFSSHCDPFLQSLPFLLRNELFSSLS